MSEMMIGELIATMLRDNTATQRTRRPDSVSKHWR
jgi:hypothetical protein